MGKRSKESSTTPTSPKTGNTRTLFDPVVPETQLHASFATLRSHEASLATRAALDDVFQTFTDPEGNFLKDFQTTGFDRRLFELYLFAYFSRSGFLVDRRHVRPDFLVTRGSLTVAVEATTANPSRSGPLAQSATKVADLNTAAQLMEYAEGELAIRFGSALYAKLKAEYWKEPHVAGRPLVIAIEAFHDQEAHHFSDAALTQYLYGLKGTPSIGPNGSLAIDVSPIERHTKGEKVIPSGFFSQPDSEFISAVLFTNAGTHAKFTRMGYQAGVGNDVLHVIRSGVAYDPEPSAMLPAYFSYNLDAAPRVEPWGEGLAVVHNPNAKHPLPDRFFPFAADTRLIGGKILSGYQWWHPISTRTFTSLDPEKTKHGERPFLAPINVGSITKDAFHAAAEVPEVPGESAWFCDDTESFLGAVVANREKGTWDYALFARDKSFVFHMISLRGGFASCSEAGRTAQHEIVELLRQPRRLFKPMTPSSVADDDR
jgi:hypothetical protein